MVSDKLAFLVVPQSNLAFSTKRIGINFVPKGRCTNSCLFCAPNIPAMKRTINNEVLISREHTIKEYLKEISIIYSKNTDVQEIIITGTIGEPLLYFNKLTNLIFSLKKRFHLFVRLNTNGQANIILPNFSSEEITKKLEKSGLDSIVISLNAINENDYNKLCRPKNKKSFKSVLDFIKSCNKSRIKTFVSFVDYSNSKYPSYPKLDKRKISTFCNFLGLNKEQIIYRPILD